MSGQQDTAELLAHLEDQKETGCLTVDSADGRLCRIYLLFGEVVHAEGAATEGKAALDDALSWPDVTLSFDERARLPNKHTIAGVSSSETGVQVPEAKVRGPRTSQTLSADRPLTTAMFAYMGAGCLFALLLLLGFAVAVSEGALHIRIESILGPVVVLLFATGALWVLLYLRYRVMFRRNAVRVEGGLAKPDIPRVLDAPGIVVGEPELVVSLPTRCLLGRLGKCRVEFFASGLQIWKGPGRPEPRWQLAYADLLQAELVTIEASGSRNSRDQYSLRLIAGQPRMAFLFGNVFSDREVRQMLNEFREHGVATFDEA